MIKTVFIDNWLDNELAEYLSSYFYKDIPYYTNHKSLPHYKTSHLMGVVTPTPMTGFLFNKIQKIMPVDLIRMYTNLQYITMDGNWHPDIFDGSTHTFLYMLSKNVEGGEFEIQNEKKYEYKFNRLIWFDARKMHKGLAPTNNVPRVTLAFKTKLIEEK
tara:strand:+ start:1584 stop:2060 length:477 start_codon:yes stop_codon:yes gene_type:complete